MAHHYDASLRCNLCYNFPVVACMGAKPNKCTHQLCAQHFAELFGNNESVQDYICGGCPKKCTPGRNFKEVSCSSHTRPILFRNAVKQQEQTRAQSASVLDIANDAATAKTQLLLLRDQLDHMNQSASVQAQYTRDLHQQMQEQKQALAQYENNVHALHQQVQQQQDLMKNMLSKMQLLESRQDHNASALMAFASHQC